MNYITIKILDIIHCPVFYLRYDVSETEFCFRLQMEPTHMGPINRNHRHKPIEWITCLCQGQFKVTLRLTDGRSVSQSVCQPTLQLVTRYYFLSDCCYLKFSVLFLWGALSDERTGLQFAAQSHNGSSRAEPVTILYSLI
jgi:hypothetical protein